MVAAEITPTLVQKRYLPATSTYGTPVRLIEYFVKFTKVTQADWIDASTYCPGTYLGSWGFTIDGSADGGAETMTFDETNDDIIFGSSDVGTAYAYVICQEA